MDLTKDLKRFTETDTVTIINKGIIPITNEIPEINDPAIKERLLIIRR